MGGILDLRILDVELAQSSASRSRLEMESALVESTVVYGSLEGEEVSGPPSLWLSLMSSRGVDNCKFSLLSFAKTAEKQ